MSTAAASLDLDHLRQWIGRTHESTDHITAQMVRGLPYYGEDWKNYVKPYEAKNDPPAAETQRFIAFTKLVNEASGSSLSPQLAAERDHFVRNLHHANAGIGISAFLEKKTPRFE